MWKAGILSSNIAGRERRGDERERPGPRWLSNVLSLQHREPFLRRCASKFGHPRLQFSARRSYVGGCKMGFNSTYWHERAGEMRKIAALLPWHAAGTLSRRDANRV